MTGRRFVYGCGLAVVLIAIGLGAWKLKADRDYRQLEAREYNDNSIKAVAVAGLHSSRFQPVEFSKVTVDNATLPNGRKPKVIIDPDGSGGVVGAQKGGQGFALYPPGQPPKVINSYRGGIGAEDAQAADVTGNHFPDIIVGGLDNVTFILFNPRDDACANVYQCQWKRTVIDRTHPSHDIVVGDVDRNGRIDIATESGIYFNQGRGHEWTFVGRRLIPRDGEGTSLASLENDGILDVVAPYLSGTILARFINPLHHGGDPAHEVWKVQAIDSHPLFSGNMTTAIADIDGDGHNDIVLAPMYGGGGLVWYEAPKPTSGVWKRHMIDATINFVHQGSLQIADFNGNGHPDIAFAEQDQSPTRRVGVLYNMNGNGSGWRMQILSLNGGQNIKVGPLGANRQLGLLSARHGFLGGANPLLLWKVTQVTTISSE